MYKCNITHIFLSRKFSQPEFNCNLFHVWRGPIICAEDATHKTSHTHVLTHIGIGMRERMFHPILIHKITCMLLDQGY